ncbi:NTP transferase domain-containing protein [Microbacterium sp. M3]|uniref:NTP transferase domain-containing protein n=1 Tax=Microbacterium arthrosphaerae TaxID=792652 RepID=A0ABU4GYX2_9MICO|nr:MULTISPECIES: NTP transferase domain-containing protein [Microbacterium]MDW4571640.1 NTP transferase domain-containing protein [Microbacterium arthrosphaerae]MDW7605495.1 NTP transferase domain-containing protein [Microbacterium sp. M3]
MTPRPPAGGHGPDATDRRPGPGDPGSDPTGRGSDPKVRRSDPTGRGSDPRDRRSDVAGLGAILLAGGRASRVGGAAKPLFDVGGRTLLAAAVTAATDASARPITVVGPVLDESLPVAWVREDPPFGGPAAAVVAALASWPEEDDPTWTLLLACDLAGVGAAVRRLVDDIVLLPSDTDGLCLADQSSRPQWLIGVYRTRALRAAASALPDGGRDAPVRVLLDDLAIAVVAAPDDLTRDVDSWEDLEEARQRAAPSSEEPS